MAVIAMFEKTWRLDKFVLFVITALAIPGLAIVGMETIPESTFELASESRLPKWTSMPSGLTRADVSVSMSYYNVPLGRSARFSLRDMKGQKLSQMRGNLRGLGPSRLKHPTQGFDPGYPSYEVITVNGISDIIEHRKMEPVF